MTFILSRLIETCSDWRIRSCSSFSRKDQQQNFVFFLSAYGLKVITTEDIPSAVLVPDRRPSQSLPIFSNLESNKKNLS